MIRWKDTCRFDDLHSVLLLALLRAEEIFQRVGGVDTVWITSVNDSAHLGTSKHYLGKAVDLRTHHLPDEPTREAVAEALRAALGPQFRVIYEAAGTPTAHLHVQYQGR